LFSAVQVHIHDDDSENGKYNNSKKRGGFNKTVSSGRTLSYWCFNPGVAMEVLNKCGIRNIILTSGTLSPLDSFAYELQTYDEHACATTYNCAR